MINFNRKSESGREWITISDLMSALMLMFLFIAIVYMNDVKDSEIEMRVKTDKIEQVAQTYKIMQTELYEALYEEFKDDLSTWQADLDPATLSVRFYEPDVLFPRGSSEVTPKFRDILNEFFPRYLSIISSDRFKNDIEEIRIEGHTSSEWWWDTSYEEAYFYNMDLSQARTRSVLQYCMGLLGEDQRDWARNYITANGLSSSRLVLNLDGSENQIKSRRVEFRVRTDAEKRIAEILGEMDE